MNQGRYRVWLFHEAQDSAPSLLLEVRTDVANIHA